MISKLIPGMTGVIIKAKVISKGDKRSISTKYGRSKVCSAKLKDETGEISLTLWGDQISKVREGEQIFIKGGYVTEWNGELQLNIPKKGMIEKVSLYA